MEFIPRLTRPESGNKYYIRKANGGYSNAILGNPTDPECNVLANCVGYAYGRFNEIGQYGYCKYLAPVNAENFMQYKGSCETGMKPKLGACMVWEGKGNLAGHVASVEKIYDDNHIITSESGYGASKPFWTQDRYNNNGNWGLGDKYKFLGFIYNPAVPDEPEPPKPEPIKYNIGDRVEIKGVYISSTSFIELKPAIKEGTITRIIPGARNPYLLDDGNIGWINDACIVRKIDKTLSVGVKVKAVKTGKAASDGTGKTAKSNIEGTITRIIYNAKYPYLISNNDPIGWYKADALEII